MGEGKIFVAFLSLILKSHLENTLRTYLRKNRMTVEKALNELRKIKALRTQTGTYLLNPVTKKQRDILELFGKNERDLLKGLLSLPD